MEDYRTKKVVTAVTHRISPYERQIHPAIDRNDTEAAITAIELRFPATFSERAWKVITYFRGAMYLYSYKGKFVVTDESLELIEYRGGSPDAPYGCPRWVGDNLSDLEQWLLCIADEYDTNADEIPGWEADPPPVDVTTSSKTKRHDPSLDVMVTLNTSGEFIGVKTYCREHGSHGRFLVYQRTLRQLLDSPVGSAKYEEDCGHYLKIVRLEDALRFSFAWLTTYSYGNITGIRQDATIPEPKIRALLDWKNAEKHLYISQSLTAVVNARPAASTVREIVEDKRTRRAFSKAMRDCFHWPGERITLYPDGKRSFFFTTESGVPKNGGLILHEGTKNGYPYIFYSVHT